MKRFFALTIFTIIVLIANMSFATTTTKFEVVEDNVCTIKLNDYCEFEKKMISYDLDKRQVTIQMKVTNNATEIQPTGEVMLVLDNSSSMKSYISDTLKTRQESVFNSAKTLINNLLDASDYLKIGVVSFSTNTDVSLEGTINDASLVSELSSNASELNTAIDNIEANGPRTDLEAGITLASQYFSNEDTNKYIIVLTDGVPNVALDYDGTYYSDDVINKTKSKLESLADSYNLITMLTGISNESDTATGSTYTYGQIIEKIFGTETNPTAGKFYYITDNKIESTITKNIYNDLLPQSQTLSNIVIYDYFPQEIVDNFDFAYVSDPTKGTISAKIDTENNCIIWTIDSLENGETAVVQYTLTLKDDYSEDIVDVILDTNEKVDITYNDFDGTEKNKTSDETPKVRITETVTEEPEEEPEEIVEDTTVAPTILPYTGQHVLFAGIGIASIALVVSGTKYFLINRKMK